MGELVLSREIDPKKLKFLNLRFLTYHRGFLLGLSDLSGHHLLQIPSLRDCVSPEHGSIQKFVHRRRVFDVAS